MPRSSVRRFLRLEELRVTHDGIVCIGANCTEAYDRSVRPAPIESNGLGNSIG